jgi:hypothetical protein
MKWTKTIEYSFSQKQKQTNERNEKGNK